MGVTYTRVNTVTPWRHTHQSPGYLTLVLTFAGRDGRQQVVVGRLAGDVRLLGADAAARAADLGASRADDAVAGEGAEVAAARNARQVRHVQLQLRAGGNEGCEQRTHTQTRTHTHQTSDGTHARTHTHA